jgi:hypothetical protein
MKANNIVEKAVELERFIPSIIVSVKDKFQYPDNCVKVLEDLFQLLQEKRENKQTVNSDGVCVDCTVNAGACHCVITARK